MAPWNRGSSNPRSDYPFEVPDTHEVLGTSMHPPFPDGTDSISLGMGCFWGAERIFWQVPGVHTTAVGYQGGSSPFPTYREVCTGGSGHAEVVLVVFEPNQASLEGLLGHFWEQHDPTTLNRQGNDVGTQYRSAIFVSTPLQRAVAEASRDTYQAKLTVGGYGSITTVVEDAGPFYYAEDHHQQYLHKNPAGYCNHGFCQVAY